VEYAQAMINIGYQDILAFTQKQQNPNFDIVQLKMHTWEITKSLYPVDHSVKHIYQEIQQSLGGHDWSQSYSKPQVIYSSQEITPWVVECLHSWLRTQSCNIKNIVLVVTSHIGFADWWQQLKKLQGEKTFQVIEWLDINSYEFRYYYRCLENLPTAEKVLQDRRDLKYFFSWYGGHLELDKFYRSLRMMELADHGVVEVLADFNITRQQVIDHVEYIGYFTNIQELDMIGNLYDKYIDADKKTFVCKNIPSTVGAKSHNEEINFAGYQYSIDRQCFATVVRETTDLWQYSTVTEKTLRGFIHHMAVIPAGYKTVNNLEQFGFWFPHDIIDYGYQWESDYLSRFTGMIESIKRTVSKFSMDDLNNYYQENFARFRDNANICKKYYKTQT